MTEPEQVEQITKEPSAAPIREKDPKRVAAGKALQVKNRAAKEELLRYRAQEAERNKQMRKENERYKATEEEERMQVGDSGPSPGFLSEITLTNILSLVGVGLTIYALFFKKEAKQQVMWKEPIETTFVSQQEEKRKEAKTKNRPKFGM